MIERIYIRTHNKYVKQAALFGLELQAIEHKENEEAVFSSKQENAINDAIKDSVKRRMKENLGKING